MSSEPRRHFLGTYHYPHSVRVLEILGILAYGGFAGITSTETARVSLTLREAGPGVWLALALSPFVAYLLGDFMSGLVHCAADNFGEETTPFFGAAFIRPFRDHHRDPEGITRHDFIEVNGNSCLVNLVVLVPAYFLIRGSSSPWSVVGGVFSLAFTLSIVLTNQIHKWAHQSSRAGWVTALQKLHLILRPDVHQIHHTPPFDRYYCITSGWLNPVLEKAGFFDWLVKTFDWARPANLPIDFEKKVS